MNGTFPLRVRHALDDAPLGAALGRMSAPAAQRADALRRSTRCPTPTRSAIRRARPSSTRCAICPRNSSGSSRGCVANGAHVHWADTGRRRQPHRDRDRAGSTASGSSPRAKSMVSEETHLNAALEAAGLEVVETDLGEYIVQLADDRPSHIVAPIIHMSRADVGRVMHERLADAAERRPGRARPATRANGCGASSSTPTWASPARISASSRPARSAWSPTRATDAW